MALLLSSKARDTLENKRKIVLRQAEAHVSHAAWVAREEPEVEKGWKTPTRRALLERTASQYQSASAPEKKQITTRFVAATGYVRKYAVWVLNHAEEILQAADAPRSRYGPEVQQALVLAWETLNQICAKRLIPFLSDFVASLEECGHLHLSGENRRILLSMSAATADRLLQAPRRKALRSLSTTKAGPLLKQQIPIRTFAEWNEAQPGFLEIDLVAHCGPDLEGSFLYTLTLTDVATGWTECLPLLHRGQEAVVAALQRAQTLFPFPLLGIDVDNGGEFINEEVASFCAREQITFTRGRPHEKRDQCFIEQKNRVVVRQVVGRDRFEGEHAARQLTELYRALRLYVNYFQPSMKLLAKEYEGRKVRRVYDPAKTPLQRLLLSGTLPAFQEQELRAVARALDPLRLFQQLRHLQQAVFRCAVGNSHQTEPTPLLVFAAECCTTGQLASHQTDAETEGFSLPPGCQERPESRQILTWRRTSKDPFAEQWEQILSWMQADPARTSGDIFRALQALFPGRYQPLQIRTLQRGMRKIRARLLQMQEESWPQELIHGSPPAATKLKAPQPVVEDLPVSIQSVASLPEKTRARSGPPKPTTEAPRARAGGTSLHVVSSVPSPLDEKQNQGCHPALPLPTGERDEPTSDNDGHLTIELAIPLYLERYGGADYQKTTLRWHRAALGQFQQYLSASRHLMQVCQITEADLHGWFAFLNHTPRSMGKPRAALTIEIYVCSARAFCLWLVERGDLARFRVSEGAFPRTRSPLPSFLPPETFEQFVQASVLAATKEPQAHQMLARDRAILWLFFETGISTAELCALRVSDLEQETGTLRVRGQGGKERQMVLGSTCLNFLLASLDQSRTARRRRGTGSSANDNLLFCSENGRPLTTNSLTLLFHRLRKRAGMREITITPQILRHSFALRYLQAGGDPRMLQELLGYAGMAQVRQYLCWHEQLLHSQTQKGAEET